MVTQNTDSATAAQMEHIEHCCHPGDHRDNLYACEAWRLLDMARTVGLRFMHIPGLASQVLVWGERTPESDRIAAALHARVEEVAQILPYPAAFAERADERHHREDVLHEPDIPLGDLPIPVAKAMITRWVLDLLEAERDNEAWVRATVGCDAPARTPLVHAKKTRRHTSPQATASDRVVY